MALEPGFARAHAGLSFVHFQNAFLRHVPDREAEIEQARARAERGLELDPLDPFVNFNLGRSYWLGRTSMPRCPGSSGRPRSARTTRTVSTRAG